jgi:hypothetical protein
MAHPRRLDAGEPLSAEAKLYKRLMVSADADVRWRSIPAAIRGSQALIAAGLKGDALVKQVRYLEYLREREHGFALAKWSRLSRASRPDKSAATK